ncbi:MAG: hypothetical protein Q4F13_12330 [Pseudomonadota bacterium]|nr:hypothetical protein [Pseudomonadota bacterium]
MPALSLRLDEELDMRLAQEVARRKTTKAQFVQQLLREALAPRDPVALLHAVRAQYGLPDASDESVPLTDRSQNVKTLARLLSLPPARWAGV